MATNNHLSLRLEEFVKRKQGFVKMKMFGGVGFLLRGNMCFGVYKDYLILRLGETQAITALKNKNAKEFDITGRAMKGWAMIHERGAKTDAQLQKWLGSAVKFVKTLPPKL